MNSIPSLSQCFPWLSGHLTDPNKKRLGGFALSVTKENELPKRHLLQKWAQGLEVNASFPDGFRAKRHFKDEDTHVILWTVIPGAPLPEFPLSRDSLLTLVEEGLISSFLILDKNKEEINWFNGEWSNIRFFFQLKQGELFLASEGGAFKATTEDISLAFTKFFIEYGWCPENLLPIQNTSLSKENTLYSFSASKGIEEKEIPSPFSPTENLKSTEQIYDLVRKKVALFMDWNQIRHLPLTGGADTRFILSTLTDIDSNVFFFRGTSTGKKADNDKKIFRHLVQSLDLNAVLINDFENPENNEYFGSFSRGSDLTVFKLGDIHLNGHGGGELLGGFLETMDGTEYLYKDSYLSPSLDWGPSLKEVDLSDWKKPLFQVSQDQATPAFYRSFIYTSLSDFYNDPHWASPMRLFYQSNSWSPFLHPEVLNLLTTEGFKYRYDYQFYREIYQNHAPDLIQHPFQSPIVDKERFQPVESEWEDPVIDPKEPEIKSGVLGEAFLPIGCSGTHIKRLNMLNRYLEPIIKD